jgi:putative transcriptional regulator
MENRIREFREELGLTQQVLATMTGVSRQTIISLENGRYNPSILLAFRIARLFGRQIEEVFVYREENEHE